MSRVRHVAAGCLAVLGVGVLASSTSAAADSSSPKATFALTAAADGVSLVVHNESIPELPTIQANTPTAQANTNSRGQSTAYSTAPDPGQGTAELPAALGATLCSTAASDGLTIPNCSTLTSAIPTYPFAYAQAGDDPQDQDFAAAHLHAEATSSSAFGQTTVGAAGAASATSTARTTGSTSDGTASATAESSVDGLALSTALNITGIDAKASIKIDSSGKITPSASFSAGSVTVAGMGVVGIKDGQFVVAGTSTPIPAQTVFDALKALGITAEFIPEDSSPTSVTSQGLQLSYTAPGAPSGVIPPLPVLSQLPIGIGLPTTPTTVTYVLGRAQVTAKYKQLPAAPSTDTFVPPADTPTSSAPTSSAASSAPAVVTPVTPPTDTSGSGGAIVDTPPVTTADPGTLVSPPDVAPTTDQGTTGTPVASAKRVPFTSHSIDIYLALVIAALGSFAAATAVRHLGVRLSWTS